MEEGLTEKEIQAARAVLWHMKCMHVNPTECTLHIEDFAGDENVRPDAIRLALKIIPVLDVLKGD